MPLADTVALPSGWPSVGEWTSRRLLRSGDLHGARCALEPELTIARERGALPDRYRLLRDLADVERHAGQWELSGRYLDEIEKDAEPDSWAEAEITQRRAALAAVRGRAEEARELAAQGEACADAINWLHLAAMNRWGIGSLQLSLGDPENAWHALEDIPRTETWGRLEAVEAVADANEALVGLGDLEAAQELLRTLQKDRDRGHLWAGPGTLRCEALLLLARGSPEAAVAAAEEAAGASSEEASHCTPAARLLVAGEALRDWGERRRAGGEMDEAARHFAELGAACGSIGREGAGTSASASASRRELTKQSAASHRSWRTGGRTGRSRRSCSRPCHRGSPPHSRLPEARLRSRTELARAVAEGTLDLSDV